MVAHQRAFDATQQAARVDAPAITSCFAVPFGHRRETVVRCEGCNVVAAPQRLVEMAEEGGEHAVQVKHVVVRQA